MFYILFLLSVVATKKRRKRRKKSKIGTVPCSKQDTDKIIFNEIEGNVSQHTHTPENIYVTQRIKTKKVLLIFSRLNAIAFILRCLFVCLKLYTCTTVTQETATTAKRKKYHQQNTK